MVGLEYADFPEVTAKNRTALAIFVRLDRGQLQMLRNAAMNDLVLDNAAAELGPSRAPFRTVVTRTGSSVPVVNVTRVSSA
ncbi:hypothetical protein [Nocardioides sp.]|uniref:hypothetical protein n=1 Tax=Nocardioides sp. TaxID=35761 RepID=UPI0027344A84|nr:hypothetical protein [Nocardioides sp.]MDP3893339.1 hypothetical protein [Nocardioides sp.]